jgi:hypothetical protein
MIDYENKVFNYVHPYVAPLCAKDKFVSTIITEKPTAFPAASLIEMDNTTVRRLQSSTPVENYALVTYQLEIYATTKASCKKVLAAADKALLSLNFTRMSAPYIDNAGNTKVFRYVARYEAMVDQDGNFYRA